MHVELVSRVYEAVNEVVARRALVGFLVEEGLQASRFRLRRGRGEDDALALLDGYGEIAWHIQVFRRRIAALLLFLVFKVAIPVGVEHELGLLRELHVEVRVTVVHPGAYAVAHLLVVAARLEFSCVNCLTLRKARKG